MSRRTWLSGFSEWETPNFRRCPKMLLAATPAPAIPQKISGAAVRACAKVSKVLAMSHIMTHPTIHP